MALLGIEGERGALWMGSEAPLGRGHSQKTQRDSRPGASNDPAPTSPAEGMVETKESTRACLCPSPPNLGLGDSRPRRLGHRSQATSSLKPPCLLARCPWYWHLPHHHL